MSALAEFTSNVQYLIESQAVKALKATIDLTALQVSKEWWGLYLLLEMNPSLPLMMIVTRWEEGSCWRSIAMLV